MYIKQSYVACQQMGIGVISATKHSVFSIHITVKILNKGHPFCRAGVATPEGFHLVKNNRLA